TLIFAIDMPRSFAGHRRDAPRGRNPEPYSTVSRQGKACSAETLDQGAALGFRAAARSAQTGARLPRSFEKDAGTAIQD
ncbi:hypothetical protein, partial [Sinorhizobium medicae]|uniref:hypothetical protein n=1 Tax=Sinorhizobium medicae TaxID=110321 RepID=UPI001AEC88E5